MSQGKLETITQRVHELQYIYIYILLIALWDIVACKRDLRSRTGIIRTTRICISIYVNYISPFFPRRRREANLYLRSEVTGAVLY
jgi:hypothetical protein